ncbi:MAG TPA: transglycosylase SLT domain-containing protein [Bacteroidales bacterium]|nr:transglycosylase SLT domain-containing protein [Bacteroidales bacterium]
MKKAAILVTFLLLPIISFASFPFTPLPDTIIITSDDSYDRIDRDLDSLISSWYVSIAMKNHSFGSDSAGIEYPDTVYERRLGNINSVINLPYNSIIRNHIHVYTIKQREKFCAVLGLMDYYFPMIEDIFDSYGLPAELKYMAVIESALNPNAVSRAGATGLWQFMYSTGRMYGLLINSVVDERRDPIKATHAAARYLRDLYKIYEDWGLVIAAYNCGPGNVNKAIKRSGNKKDYWDIYYRLPRETRGYLPQYVAAAYGVTYFAEHGLKPLPLNIPIATDTIMVNKDIHLSQISGVMNIPLGELRALNPQYRTGLVPGSSRPQSLTLPISHLSDFIDLNDTIRNYKAETYLSKTTRIEDPTRSTATASPAVTGKARLVYTVKSGDNLGFISEWYRVSLSDLRYWNNIYKNTIRVGQKLVIYVDPSKSEYFSGINSMSFAEKQAMSGKSVPVNAQKPVAKVTTGQTEGEYEVYTVRRGDTIWDIVKMYENVTTSDVLNLNGISDPEKIMVGQRLKIRKKS